MTVFRIIARRVSWPDLAERSNREGLRLRWDVFAEDGRLLAEATEYPLQDGAHVLMTHHGFEGHQIVAMRHDGKDYDSFLPLPLAVAAAPAARRVADRARLALLRLGDRKDGALSECAVPECFPCTEAHSLPMHVELTP